MCHTYMYDIVLQDHYHRLAHLCISVSKKKKKDFLTSVSK